MNGLWLCVTLAALFCAVSSSQEGISGAEVELRVRPGDTVTVYCDCKLPYGDHIVWYRNCSHENQPTLVMSTLSGTGSSTEIDTISNPFPGFKLVWNKSNNTFDLLIENVTEFNLGLYYCGIEEKKLMEEGKQIAPKYNYHYGNVTRLSFELDLPEPASPDSQCELYWMLLFTLCPGCALISSLLSFALIYHFFSKETTSKKLQGNPQTDNEGRGSRVQEEGEVCYAALEICQGQKRSKKKRTTPSSDFSTYSDIKTSGV